MAKDTFTPDRELNLDTLAGDVRDAMLMQIRDMQKPWARMSEDEQRGVNNNIEAAARGLVRDAVGLFTNYEFPRVVVGLGEVKIKGEKGIEGKITCANLEHNRSVLGEHVGEIVLMLMVDSEAFMGEREPAEVAPDQPVLPVI